MLQEYFEKLITGIETKLAEKPDGLIARKRFALEAARLGRRLYSSDGNVAWCGVLVPFDLLAAMGVTSCFVEFIGAHLALSGRIGPLLEEAENDGHSMDSCSYHRAVAGATRAGLVPEPRFLIGTSTPCVGGLAALENLACHFGKELHVIDIPQRNDEQGITYLADQLRTMVDFVSAHTGRPLDTERLKRSIDNTNRSRVLLTEIYRLARCDPSPARASDLASFFVVFMLFMGSEAGLEVAQTYHDEFRRKAESGAAEEPNTRIRLLWMQNRIQFKNPLERLIAEKYGAVVVVDELNDFLWEAVDGDDPFVGLARRTLANPLTGPIENRIRNLQRLAREYNVDGAVNPCHWGCRQGTGGRGQIEKGLKQIGIPVLNLEVDCLDPRQFSEGQLRTRLEAFIEMISKRKQISDEGRA